MNNIIDFDYVKLPLPAVFEKLNTSENGLREEEVRKRLKIYGHNRPVKKKEKSVMVQFLSRFANPLVVVLLIIAGFSTFFGEKINALIVVLMAVMSVFLSFFQEYRAGKEAQKLSELVRATATVIRHGKTKEVKITEIVPGDIVDLYAGDIIPADLRIISGKDLFVNQASLTGESLPVEKFANDPTANIAYMGSSVVSGTALGVVIKTGTATKFGEMASAITAAQLPTSFDRGIRDFTWLMIRFMIIFVVFIFAVNVFIRGEVLEAFLFSLAVAVGLTPEMLPMLITVNLSKGAMSMAKKEVIVKRLSSIQNFGAMDVLCTDKTGTLTLDKIILEKYCDVQGREARDVLTMAYMNSYYQTGLKNLLDVAVLTHVELHRELEIATAFRKVDEVPFDFQRRRMSVIVAEHDEHHLLICKGAVDEILGACSRVRHGGVDEPLTAELLAQVREVTASLNEEGLRVVAVAAKELPPTKEVYGVVDERDLTLIGYVTFLDPPKETAGPALKALADHGVAVKVMTGDNELVTAKICRQVGLPVSQVVVGADVERMTDAELSQAAESHNIFAKLTPAQKERIVRALKANGHVVGFMGDGINDAAALRTADIGISVDSGVDIAKEAADIILLEKSLMVLEEGVIEGRKTFVNMLKYIKMAASSNFGNMFSVLVASAFLPFLPMLPMQLLVQNLLYDLSQIAIPFDNVDEELLRKPQRWNPGDLGRFMVFFGPISSIFDILTYTLMWFVFSANSPDHQTLFQSGWFVEGLLTQTLIVHTIRTQKIPFLQSRASGALLFATSVIMAIGVFLPMGPVAEYFKMQPLPAMYFAFLIAILLGYMVLTQAMKGFYTRRYGWQ
jgi:Mg2+-importing ATPase